MDECCDNSRFRFMRFLKSPSWYLSGLKKHPLLVIFIIGILIRVILIPLVSYRYDSAYWVHIVSDIVANQGLYESGAYHYTPIWGYILGASSMVGDIFGIGAYGYEFIQPYVNSVPMSYHLNTIPTIGFGIMVKTVLVIFDILVAWLIYSLIKRKTQDERKAIWGFSLWFLCPIVFVTSSVLEHPETICVFFTICSLVLMHKEKYFIGGACFGIAIMTKAFPIILLPLIIGYIIARYSNKKRIVKCILMSAVGLTLSLLIICLPQITSGSLSDLLYFLTLRTGSGTDSMFILLTQLNYSGMILLMPFIFIISAYLAFKLTKTPKDKLLDKFSKYALICMGLILFIAPHPQYVITLIPFLIYRIVVHSDKICWIMSIIVFCSVFFFPGLDGFNMFYSLAAYTGLMSLDTSFWLTEIWLTEIWNNLPLIFFGRYIVLGVTASIILLIHYYYKQSKGDRTNET